MNLTRLRRHRIRLTIVLAIVFAVVVYAQMTYEIFAYNAHSEIQEQGVKILTFNLDASDRTISDNHANEFFEMIEKESPDILCLQEVRYKSFKKIRGRLDSMYRYSSDGGQRKVQRYILYTKYPIKNFRRIGKTNIYSADVQIEGIWTHIYSCHLTSNGYTTARRKVISENRSWLEGIPDYYKHIAAGIRKRRTEADVIRKGIDSLKRVNIPVLVIGDLNDFTGSECLDRIMSTDLADAWWNSGNGFGITYDAWHLKLRIDHVLYDNKYFIPLNSHVVDTDISDHKPLVTMVIQKDF